MTALYRALSAELLKTKRTLAFWMTFVTPLVVCALQLMILLRMPTTYPEQGVDGWRSSSNNIFVLWTILALPLLITLETALLAQTEHSEKHWKQLFALPLPRWTIYAAKWLVGAFLLLLAHLLLIGLAVGVGLATRLLRPEMGIDGPIPLAWMAQVMGQVFLISLLIHSIHTWVALHFHSFTVAVGVGMAAAVANIILINSADGQRYFPWTLAINALPTNENAQPGYALLVGILGGLLLAILGAWETTRRDVL